MKLFIPFIFVSCLIFAGYEVGAQKLAAIPYVSGLNAPIDVKNCGDDRLFVAERAGRIRIINPDGTLRATPFLDISSKISSASGEEGFLGIAFSPDYKNDGKFYVDYTGFVSGKLTTFIQEYRVSEADSNIADASSALTLLTQSQPFTNHNGGNLMFGFDGYLYINFGDGGSGGDPLNNAQNTSTFLGKILRVDISTSSVAQPYTIPASNPFYNDNTPGIKKEIWAYGVRNPWRSSVDRLTGDIWIADVGQGAREEIDYQPANAIGGRNYGWRLMEGFSCYNPSVNCNPGGLTLPIFDYTHATGIAITGGYVYRSAQSKSLFGVYLFADFGQKWIDGIRQSGGTLSGPVAHYITNAQASGSPISFGQDRYGDLYILFYGNPTVYKVEDTSSIRRPKAFITPTDKGGSLFLLQALQGKNLVYQWMKDNVIIPGATSADYLASTTGSYTLEVTNLLGFKDTSDAFLLGSSLNLTSFTAQKIPGHLIKIDWHTASELNISGYAIQRRKDNEIAFSNIGFEVSKSINGFSDNELDYTFIDSAAITYTRLFYRLQVYHTDGSLSYSDVRIITSESMVNGFLVFPNPAPGKTSIYLNEFTHQVFMRLFDANGKEVFSQILYRQNKIIELPGAHGFYIIQVSDLDGKNAVRKKLIVD